MNSFRAWWQVTVPQVIAWWMPKRLAYFVVIRVFAKASTTKYKDRTPDSINVWEALDAWCPTP